jgi:hypothetical protein
MPFAHLDRRSPPFVEESNLARAEERFARYCDEVARLGFNAVFVGNLIHLATFDRLPEGPGAVYSARSPHRLRHERYKAAFRRMAAAARARGLALCVETDFPAYTPDLVRWVVDGGRAVDWAAEVAAKRMSVEEAAARLAREVELARRPPPLDHPRLAAAYRAALEELFEEVGADMVSVRIGEGGGAYDERETGYASAVAATSVESARRVIGALLEGVEAANAKDGGRRRLLVRTWTIGIGALGNLHTSPRLYEEVFRPFAGREALVSVVKHVAMDFYEHVPRNPTIGLPGPRQVVEMQARREYELFGAVPNWKGRAAAEDFARLREMPGVVGVSVWPTNGGFLWPARTLWGVPERAGAGEGAGTGTDTGTGTGTGAIAPHAEWIDANVFLYARLAAGDPRLPEALARAWARERGGASSEEEAAEVAAVLERSEELTRRGLYVGAYARSRPSLPGLDIGPTMLWLWWNRPIAGWGVQALVHRAVRDDPGGVAGAIADGEAALAESRALGLRAEALPPSPLRARLVESLTYEASVLEVLAAYRAVFLRRFEWAETGSPEARRAWLAARPRLLEALRRHEATWAGVPHLPPLDGRELYRMLADDGAERALSGTAWALAGLCLAAAAVLLLPAGHPRAREPRLGGRGGPLESLLLLPLDIAIERVPRWRAALVPRSIPAVLARALAASLVLGVAAAALVSGRHAPAVIAWTGAACLLGFLGAAIGIGVPRGEPAHEPRFLAPALPLLAPPLLLAAWLLAGYARRGPAPLWIDVAGALTEWTPRLRLGLPLLAAAALWIGLAWLGTRPRAEAGEIESESEGGGGRAGAPPRLLLARRVAGVALAALLALGMPGRLLLRDPARAVLALNDAARIGPSILGEAGTGVEDLVPGGAARR